MEYTGKCSPILVWNFDDAPTELQALSPHGGDEDWLALVPAENASRYIDWLDDDDHVSKHELPNGSVVYIVSH